MKRFFYLIPLLSMGILYSCSNDDGESANPVPDMTATIAQFGTVLPIEEPFDYADQVLPNYITKDNTGNNPIENETATLGRVLFYDQALSADNSVSCASCHQQAFAFGDTDIVSEGIAGVTGRHSMRLINTRYSDEVQYFWDERAASLEEQTTMPIQDHIEMGFSGTDGDPNLDDLIEKLEAIDYYEELFTWAYGEPVITEVRMQESIAQFIRSIQSFDSKFDEGRAQVNNNGQNFPNYSVLENQGKQLFLDPPNRGGAGCAGCHRPPEFDIDPNSRHNGVVSVAGSDTETDPTNTRAPSLRDLFNQNGILNGPLMHDGSFASLETVIAHYNEVPNVNGIDPRLEDQQLNLTAQEIEALVAFVKTLSGSDVYSNEQWSDPFEL